jgi:hypothetical protein
MTFVARSAFFAALLVSIGACGTPVAPPSDAGPADTGIAADAGPLVPHWSSGPDYPTPIAFGAALVLPGADPTTAYLYVIGGTSGTFGVGPFHAEIRRALIQGDGSLGAWEDAGRIGTGAMDNPLAGHGAFRIVGEDGSIGMAVGGGGGAGGYLPVVLGGYIQPVDGSIGMWGGFAPRLSATQGEVYGSFNLFESHQWALVGGMRGTTPLDQVIIAATMAGTSVPTWRDGPPLPAPRFGHGSVQHGTGTPDLFLIGGMGTGGMLASDILTGVRDATSLEITSWATAGTLTSAVVFPQTALIGEHVYVMGGVQGDPLIDPLATRVRVATLTPSMPGVHGTIGTFAPVPGADLPEGRAAGLVATFGSTVYIVGGMMGADHAASTSVIYAQLER